MDWHERIEINKDVLTGKPVVRGTRMAVEFVIDLLANGWTAETVLEEYPSLTVEDIQACLSYSAEVLRSERVYGLPS